MNDLLRRLLRSRGIRGLILLFGLAWLLIEALDRFGGPEAVRAEYGFAAAAILVPVHAIVAVTPFPGELIAVAHGAIYGFALGSVFSWAGWMLGALLEYSLFRRIASDVGDAAVTARLPVWLRRFSAHHLAFLIGACLVPFGNHRVNAMAGSRVVPVWRFSWVTAVALVPFLVLFAAIAIGAAAW